MQQLTDAHAGAGFFGGAFGKAGFFGRFAGAAAGCGFCAFAGPSRGRRFFATHDGRRERFFADHDRRGDRRFFARRRDRFAGRFGWDFRFAAAAGYFFAAAFAGGLRRFLLRRDGFLRFRRFGRFASGRSCIGLQRDGEHQRRQQSHHEHSQKMASAIVRDVERPSPLHMSGEQ